MAKRITIIRPSTVRIHPRVRNQLDGGALMSNIRRLSAMLNAYPPNKSVAVTKIRRIAASHRGAVPRRFCLPNTTTSTTASGTRDARPSITPINRLPLAGRANGMEMSWNETPCQPGHVEAQAIGREPAQTSVQRSQSVFAREPEEIDLPKRKQERERYAQSANRDRPSHVNSLLKS